jgi:hypothetical protein
MNSETVKSIQDALTPLATKLGEGAAHVYAIYVREQYVSGVGSIIWSVVWLLLSAAVIVGASKLFRWASKEDEEEVMTAAVIMGTGLGLVILVIATSCLDSGIQHLLNPEYYAIQDILDSVKK